MVQQVEISHLLDDLIKPLFDKHARSTTFINGVGLVRRLEQYASEGRLKSTTLLCVFDITGLYTMLPQEESLDILTKFLIKHGYQKVEGIPVKGLSFCFARK
ncbi:unnamed protein product [Didymodactylos carnosus]|uniref:Reverse transcriptase domain-containing protein n=1 Tax=Didymodactylos carnosus TaxID=1234261 RepID=A0A8S2JMC4_9BILA|nr:unnamed protein product [Didymodactylos carnosus]CAF3814540.1 unnamed protein product [Didymodactylos carnosus]